MTVNEQCEIYVSLKKTMGFKFDFQKRILIRFIEYMELNEIEFIHLDAFFGWRDSSNTASQRTWSTRYSFIRSFSDWLNVQDKRHQTLPIGLLRSGNGRAIPYIYSNKELKRIYFELKRKRTKKGLSSSTYSTILGLLIATGMRIGEMRNLSDDDVDLSLGVLLVRSPKNGKERLIPLSNSTVISLKEYKRKRIAILIISCFLFED